MRADLGGGGGGGDQNPPSASAGKKINYCRLANLQIIGSYKHTNHKANRAAVTSINIL